jgi:hypothetical protein
LAFLGRFELDCAAHAGDLIRASTFLENLIAHVWM